MFTEGTEIILEGLQKPAWKSGPEKLEGPVEGRPEPGPEPTVSQPQVALKKEEKSVKQYVTRLRDIVYKWILFAIIFFILGASMGIYGSSKYFDLKMAEIVTLKSFLFNSTVYDVRIRP